MYDLERYIYKRMEFKVKSCEIAVQLALLGTLLFPILYLVYLLGNQEDKLFYLSLVTDENLLRKILPLNVFLVLAQAVGLASTNAFYFVIFLTPGLLIISVGKEME